MNSSDLFDLHGRIAPITGGGGVLGSVMARGLARAGARVAVLGRREEPARSVAATIRAAGGEALVGQWPSHAALCETRKEARCL
jgi:NAD(P)-dependent dehydrogenase (short-subunit alcohol dehydrogenase family)